MRRIGLAICIVMAVYILIWLLRFVGGNFHKALDQRNVPMEDGRVPLVELA